MNEDRMTPEALAEIEGLTEKATAGPWEAGMYCSVSSKYAKLFNTIYQSDAAFIAASRLAVPQMAAEIRRLQALIQKIYEVADEERFLEVTAIIDAENGGSHE